MKRILVCDDDEGVSEVIRLMLEGAGYNVNILNNGHGIQKKMIAYKPDLVLLDVWMPGIDGKEITKLLKKNKNLSDIPVIVVSALGNTKDIAKNCGADDFLSKPFEMSNLLSLVKKYTN